ncbi:MAG TPA: hypothetical protein EYH36_06645, partial [Desulfocapsa sulfexigens]|nr:hypothetical protein [Desulfocapsa sulfexigens]
MYIIQLTATPGQIDSYLIVGTAKLHSLTNNRTNIYISHMSFGALSKEAKIALARGSKVMRTAIGS